MKVIFSHDVDHIGGWCHWYKDLYWEKFLIKNALRTGRIPARVWAERWLCALARRQEDVDRVMARDGEKGIRSTFFVGMANGLGMSYSYEAAVDMVRFIRKKGFDCGVHGIAYDNVRGIQSEYDRFARIDTSCGAFGVRNHYLRGRGELKMHERQAAAGYSFDSTDYEIKAPYRVNSLWEFPVCLMDASFICDGRNDLKELKGSALAALREGEAKGLSHFTVIFHDVYYNERIYPDHKAWYDWFVDYVADHYETCSFREAIAELEGKQ